MPHDLQKSCDALIAAIREELRRGLAKLYRDPSSAPLDKLGTSSPRQRP